mgnify:CR=1 FL=1
MMRLQKWLAIVLELVAAVVVVRLILPLYPLLASVAALALYVWMRLVRRASLQRALVASALLLGGVTLGILVIHYFT